MISSGNELKRKTVWNLTRFNLKSSIENDSVKNKISEEDRTKICDKCKDVLDWLDNNQTAEKEEFNYHRKELEDIAAPIMRNVHSNNANQRPNMGASNFASSSDGPTVEEVD